MNGLGRLEKAQCVVEAALELKAQDVVALDVRNVASFADTFVLATGTSDRHVRAIADRVREAVAARGEPSFGVEGYDEGRWVLLDLSDVIVHVFLAEVREHYALERLWSDAPILDAGVEAARSTAP